jgi:hypothetical protein
MATKEHNTTYTEQQAEELDRALEAQYRADQRESPPAHEYAEWKHVRRVAAMRRFKPANHAK